MEDNKKGMSTILIVVLTIIGICLVGFCTWYGVNYFKGEKELNNPVDEPSSNEIPSEPNSDFPEEAKLKGEILNFPQGNDDLTNLVNSEELYNKKVEAESNFKDVKFEKNGSTIVFNCEKYDGDANECERTKINVNNNFDIYFDGWFENLYLFKYNNYYILIDSHDYTYGMDIYINGSSVYKLGSGETLGIEALLTEKEKFYVSPVIKDSKLYFVSFTNDEDDDGLFECKYQYINLNESTIKVNTIQTFTAVNENYFL